MSKIWNLVLFIKINKCRLSANEAILLRSIQVIDNCQPASRTWTFGFCFVFFFKQANRWQCCLSFLLIDVSENKNKWSHGCLGYLFTLEMIFFFFSLNFLFKNNMKDCTLGSVLATVTDLNQWRIITISTFLLVVPGRKLFCQLLAEMSLFSWVTSAW